MFACPPRLHCHLRRRSPAKRKQHRIFACPHVEPVQKKRTARLHSASGALFEHSGSDQLRCRRICPAGDVLPALCGPGTRNEHLHTRSHQTREQLRACQTFFARSADAWLASARCAAAWPPRSRAGASASCTLAIHMACLALVIPAGPWTPPACAGQRVKLHKRRTPAGQPPRARPTTDTRRGKVKIGSISGVINAQALCSKGHTAQCCALRGKPCERCWCASRCGARSRQRVATHDNSPAVPGHARLRQRGAAPCPPEFEIRRLSRELSRESCS